MVSSSVFVLGWKFSIALMQTHPRDEVLGTSRSSFCRRKKSTQERNILTGRETISQKTATTDVTPTRYNLSR